MSKSKVYLFIQDNYRGASYGIGTYIQQLIKCLESAGQMFPVVVHLLSKANEVTFKEDKGYQELFIPSPRNYGKVSDNVYTERYMRNVAFLLTCLIPDEKTNIFHFQFMSQSTLAVWIKKIFSGKSILTVHYTDWSLGLLGDKNRLKEVLFGAKKDIVKIEEKRIVESIQRDRKVVQACDQIICIANHSYDSLKEFAQIDEDRMCIISNGLSDDYRSISCNVKRVLRKKYYLSEDQKIILFAGRLDEVKGIAYLIRAFEKVLVLYPNVHLVLAGEGDFTKWISLINRFWSKVTFTGKLERKQLYDFYRIADIGVSCSVHEEFGLVAIEMMMHKLPIVVTDTGGLAEIFDDRQTGLKVPVKKINKKRQVDVNALTMHLLYLLDHPEFASKMGKNARRKFLEKYDYENFKEKMLNVYEKITLK